MKHCFARVVVALAIAVLGIPGLLQAQGLTGQISGTITDTTGGVLPGVTIAIKNVGTGLTRETVTGTDGAFAFPDLLAGTFDLTVSRASRLTSRKASSSARPIASGCGRSRSTSAEHRKQSRCKPKRCRSRRATLRVQD